MILELHNSLLVSVLQRQPTALSNTHLRLTIISSFNKLFHLHIFLQIVTPPGMELQSWYPVIKQEGDHVSQTHSFLHPSYYLYMCDKVVAPNVSLQLYLSLKRSQRQRQANLYQDSQRSLTVVGNIKK